MGTASNASLPKIQDYDHLSRKLPRRTGMPKTDELCWKRRYGKDIGEVILRHSKYLDTHTARDDTVKKHGWNCFWLEFLKTKEATISHKNGLIQVPTTPHRDGPLRPELESRLPHGQMPELLGAYCQHILKKGLSISAAKARVNAVIWLHKVKGVRHECLKASIGEVFQLSQTKGPSTIWRLFWADG